MVKTFITLDPEYIPWAPQTPNVKLRHKHNKFVEFVLPIIAGIAVIGGIWFYVGRGPSGQVVPFPV